MKIVNKNSMIQKNQEGLSQKVDKYPYSLIEKVKLENRLNSYGSLKIKKS